MKKDDGSEYEPDSISAVKHSIERYFSEKRYGVSLNNKQFDLANKALKAKRMQLKKRGMGGKPQASEAIPPEEENAMWKSGVLGKKDGETIIFTLWYIFTKNFGLRGRDKHKKVTFGDIKTTERQLRTLVPRISRA
ncbi:uncharacterized protein KIAA1958-like [Ptychodera flava]|uniref:uncharacterized protein KIAA1958-like n=1 Tax=Ptychodera flava TaxID=63121 RepID=UPI00396A79AB